MNEELQTILLKAREDVYTLLQGGNFSKVLGQGYDFSELRAYESSDDIRHISWINSAKLGEPYVKKMHEERELNVVVALFLDGRMIIGEKQKNMSHILALLGYSALLSNNLFSSSFFVGSKVLSFEPSKNIEVVEKQLNELFSLNFLGVKTDSRDMVNNLLNIEQKSLLFIVGDFLDAVNLSVLAQKHELYALVVRDRWEETPSVSANSQLINPVTNRAMNQSLSKKALAHYVQKLHEHDAKLHEHFMAHNIKHTKIYDENEILEKLELLFYQ